MTDEPKPEPQPKPAPNTKGLLYVGIVFFAIAVVFLTTQMSSALWISFFSIGIVFVILGTANRTKSKAPESPTDPE